MQLNEEQLKLLESLGANFFSIEKAAIVLEVNVTDLKKELQNPDSEAYKKYFKGMYLTEMELRQSIFKQAKRGSSPAQKQALDLFTEMKTANL